MFYLQLSAAVVSLLIGLFNLTKESAPLVKKVQENHQQALMRKQQEDAVARASKISQMGIQWQYRGNDGIWRYYSDGSGRYWCRVNIQGVQEYCENPNYQIAASHVGVVR